VDKYQPTLAWRGVERTSANLERTYDCRRLSFWLSDILLCFETRVAKWGRKTMPVSHVLTPSPVHPLPCVKLGEGWGSCLKTATADDHWVYDFFSRLEFLPLSTAIVAYLTHRTHFTELYTFFSYFTLISFLVRFLSWVNSYSLNVVRWTKLAPCPSAGLTHKRTKRALRAPSGKGAPSKSGWKLIK